MAADAPPLSLNDRLIEVQGHFTVSGEKEGSVRLDHSAVRGNGATELHDVFLRSAFTGEEDSYQLRYLLPSPILGNGVAARVRLCGWDNIRYLAIGYTADGAFRHVKIGRPPAGGWFNLSIAHNDLAWGLANAWQPQENHGIADIRLYIKGSPGANATLDVSELAAWREADSTGDELLGNLDAVVPSRVIEAIDVYQKKCFRQFKQQAESFLKTGECQFYGNVSLDWPLDSVLPLDIEKSGTYRYSWHSNHLASILMLFARENARIGPVFAARDLISGWLERSYDQVDADGKYAWYDHGTAERCLAMIQLFALGQAYDYDWRFMQRLRSAIFRHAQLLASEAFYASHQSTRYHNHAWFQDLGLLATALAFPAWPCADSWAETALWRLEDQFDKLIVRDNGYAVFVENSIGYHHGVQRIVEFAGDLARLSGRDTPLPDVAKELARFSNFFRYPDSRRTPSQGDTFRVANDSKPNPRGKVPYSEPSVTVLPKAGYAVVKGNHEGSPFMLCMFATSLSRTHKHEDNLSFTLYFDGVEWLIDPSFYSHEYEEPIPAYLRSAAAHNAVHIPHTEYLFFENCTRLEADTSENRFSLIGKHEAYEHIHIERRVDGCLDKLNLTFYDNIISQASDNRQAFMMLHCGEGVTARMRGKSLILEHPGSRFHLECDLPNAHAKKFSGQTEGPVIRGVGGRGFMEYSPIVTIECPLMASENSWFVRVDANSER